MRPIRKYSPSVAAADKTISSYEAEIEKLCNQAELLFRQSDYINKCRSVLTDSLSS